MPFPIKTFMSLAVGQTTAIGGGEGNFAYKVRVRFEDGHEVTANRNHLRRAETGIYDSR